jgi:hypothetical protein
MIIRAIRTTLLAILGLFICFMPTASAVITNYDDYCVRGGDCALYDPNACGGTSPAGQISGDLKSLAQQILDNKSITYDPGPTRDQFKRLADGQQAQTDNGRGVDVQPIILVAILHLAKSHKMQISALTDGSSHTAPTNPHGAGKAVDIDYIDGQGTNGSDANANTIINSVAEVLPAGARFGMGNGPFGTKEIAGKTFSSFADNPNHVHVDVLGVSQAADDAAVQAVAGDNATDTTGGKVFILGDSITAKSQAQYQLAFQSKHLAVSIDASSSRTLTAKGDDGNKLSGLEALAQDKSEIDSAGTVVIALGTNGGNTKRIIEDAIGAIGTGKKIYWVDTIAVGRTDDSIMGDINKVIYSQADSQKYQVISWFKAVDPNGDPQDPAKHEKDSNGYIDNSDGLGVHPNGEGSSALANLVANTVSGGTDSAQTASCCNTESGGGNDALVGSNNVQRAFNFLVSTGGFTADQAAGIVGNMMYESSVDPHKVEGGGSSATPSGTGWGIVQFTPPSKAQDIYDSLHLSGDIGDLDVQLQLVLGQLQGKSSNSEKQAGDDIKTTNTYQEAVLAFQGNKNVGGQYSGYERPRDEAGSVGTRTNNAHDVLQKYGGNTSGTGASCSTSPSSSGISGYKNPFRDIKNLTPNRIDQGVDYTGSGPIYAIGSGKVLNVNNDGWTGIGTTPTFIVYQLDAGPAAGKYVFFAEGCTPKVSIGDKVANDTVICNMLSGNNSIEIGWANGSRLGEAAAHNEWVGHNSTSYYTAYGENFSQFLVKLGAPPGTKQAGAQKLGSLPDGWPKW